MNILFISDNFPPERNASASRVYERARYWVKWGNRVTVLTGALNFPDGKVFDGYRNYWHKVEELDGIRVIRVKTFIAPNQGVGLRTLDFLSFMFAASIAGLFEKRPDVVAATSPQFFSAVAGQFLARMQRRPFVFELSDLWPASIEAVGVMRSGIVLRAIEKIELALYHSSAKIVALTSSFREDLIRRGIPSEKIAVVINGVDATLFAPRDRSSSLMQKLGLAHRFVVGYLGTLGMAHALERVLDAAEILRNDDMIRFLFVGAGAARARLIREAADRGLSNVIFVPAQPKEAMPDYWSLCDIALVHLKNSVLFSTVIPSKIFEAMAMGLPVMLAAPEGEATGIIRSNSAGVVVPPEQPMALAQAVVELQRSGARLSELAANSLRAATLYTRERQAREMLSVLHEAAALKGMDITSDFSIGENFRPPASSA
ncbi:MAG: glycosyltransferase family 4 protein [Deltaproteobacteria bacterium]|nr:glycosyltransferase family 4 protein [Deltaproteobacteria bacterium]